MIRRALGVNSGQFASRIGDGDRTRCGELPRRVAIALPTARSVGVASDKPQIGTDVINTKVTFSGKRTAKLALLSCRSDSACRREEATPTASEAVFRVRGHEALLTGAGMLHTLENDLLH
jgi:hypothetical protein